MNLLITGAGGNLGTAVVEASLNKGHYVWGVYGKPDTKESPSDRLKKLRADLTNPEEAKSIVDGMAKEVNTIDGAILTAGGFSMGSLSDISAEDIHNAIRLNFDTAYNVVRPLLSKIRKGGKIFLIGAKPALETSAQLSLVDYGLSKTLIFRLAELINASRDEHQVDGVVIVPSIIDTPPNREAMSDMDFSKWVKPEEIAKVVMFYLDQDFIREPVIKVYGEM